MQKVFDSGSVTDRQEGEAQAVELVPGQDAPDLSYAASNGVHVLLYVTGNLATGDPAGDANAAADLADSLELNRSPSPPLALAIDADTARRNEAELSRYAPVWADVIASRGYAPVIRSEADVIFGLARGGSYFTGAWVDAFDLGGADGPLPDPASVPGLPSDVFPAWRAYRYTDGLSSAQDGSLGRFTPPPDPAAEQPADVPAPAAQPPAPSAFAPPPAAVTQEHLNAQTSSLQSALSDHHASLLEAIRGELDQLRDALGLNNAPTESEPPPPPAKRTGKAQHSAADDAGS